MANSLWQRLTGRSPEPERGSALGQGAMPSPAASPAAATPASTGGRGADQPTGMASPPAAVNSRLPAVEAAASQLLKRQRLARREALFTAIREAMQQGGVGPQAYRFKVLTLDGAGQNFIVMFDVQPEAMDASPQRLAAHEAMIKRLAQDRMALGIKSVYWRVGESGAGPGASAAAAPAVASAPSVPPVPAPASTAAAQTPPASTPAAAPVPAAGRPAGPRANPRDEITEAELMQLRQALRQGGSSVTAAMQPGLPAVEPGFEPTQPMDIDPDSDFGPLSHTQPGALE